MEESVKNLIKLIFFLILSNLKQVYIIFNTFPYFRQVSQPIKLEQVSH